MLSLIGTALSECVQKRTECVLLDGFPRTLDQAKLVFNL